MNKVCIHCEQQRKSKARYLSPHAIETLMTIGELGAHEVGMPMCDDCYDELRNILIEHLNEELNSIPQEEIEDIKYSA